MDAIISDPPFGRREQFVSNFPSDQVMHADDLKPFQYLYQNETSEQLVQTVGSPMVNNPLAAIILLLQLADKRLKAGGRLVFWLPTVPCVAKDDVEKSMMQLRDIALSQSHSKTSLKFVRSSAEELSYAIWRWLVVFEKS